MPRQRKDDIFAPVRHQATRVLATISQEIQRREKELQELVRHAATWRAVVGSGRSGTVRAPRAGGAGAVSRLGKRRGRPRARVSWDQVLSSVPKQFEVSDILKHPGARSKGRLQIYAALARWSANKKVKRIGFGKYEKTGRSARVAAGHPKTTRKTRRRRVAVSAKRVVAMKRAARRSKRSRRAKG
jgi:hypothetical protein